MNDPSPCVKSQVKNMSRLIDNLHTHKCNFTAVIKTYISIEYNLRRGRFYDTRETSLRPYLNIQLLYQRQRLLLSSTF